LPETLHIYLHEPLRSRAEAGEINFFNKMAAALPGWTLRYHEDTEAQRLAAPLRGYGLFHMQEPPVSTILCLRRAYHYPFWRIEATNERWHFDVAKAAFDPADVPMDQAERFFTRWRPKIFRDGPTSRDGFVFMPLQGRLQLHRSFQSQSPIDMIRTVLALWPDRPIKATLHPKEEYSDEDHRILARIEAESPAFQLIQGDAKDLLATCDLVVTQNSSVALTGYFAQKPAILFAGADFHHIAASVWRDGPAAVRQVPTDPDFIAYLWWFFQRQSINAGAADAEERIRERLARHGFPV
jgi:hypothetical protein